MVLGIKSRGQPRAKIKWPVLIQTTSGSISGETQNISTSGAFIFCQDPSALEENFQIIIKVPHRQSLSISAKVIWKTVATMNDQAPGSGIGVQFSGISADDRRLLQALIAKHRK
jgi:Tfp pilus assembly protein PilZ